MTSVFSLIALRISTFWTSAFSASSAACSSVSRSFCDWRLPASSSTGPVYAAWMEKSKFNRMNGLGSKLKYRYAFPAIQIATATVWTIKKVHEPIPAEILSASFSPNDASSWWMTLTGCLWSSAFSLRTRSVCLSAFCPESLVRIDMPFEL